MAYPLYLICENCNRIINISNGNGCTLRVLKKRGIITGKKMLHASLKRRTGKNERGQCLLGKCGMRI